ncbi:lectin, mannose binding 1 [Phyllostomus discolor]|uniref:Lectin, mannose binding 1 n=1 Tax=Phyllostomus discolor TaxID=89673 RepID=A0A833Z8J7_9CHIR|nr:lectin, mannose binding 1 [Phyllostomus discolor]
MWNGVGIFFDSFDNDGKKNNPAIVIVGNNGQINYDHQNDGTNQALASCQRDFRNKPYPVRAKVTYYQKTLTVMINNGFTPDKNDYEFCAKVENMIVPAQGHFGVSAATGGLADDHDVLSFLTFQLTEPGKEPPTPDKEISEKEKEKYQEEFEHFQQELDKKKEEFQKDHPDLQGQPADEIFESVGDRELIQIFEGQNRIHLEIKQLNRQLDMILDEQRKYVSSLAEELSKRGAGTPGQHGQISQQELDTVANTQQEILRQVNEIKNSMSETVRLVSGMQHPGSAGGVYETTQHFNDIKEHLHLVKRDVENLAQRNAFSTCSSVFFLTATSHPKRYTCFLNSARGYPHPAPLTPSSPCRQAPSMVRVLCAGAEGLCPAPANERPRCPDLPPFPSCLSTVHFVVFVVVQTVLFIGYIMYKTQQEAAAKKFF